MNNDFITLGCKDCHLERTDYSDTQKRLQCFECPNAKGKLPGDNNMMETFLRIKCFSARQHVSEELAGKILLMTLLDNLNHSMNECTGDICNAIFQGGNN